MIHCYITDNLRSHMIDSAPSLKKKREKKKKTTSSTNHINQQNEKEAKHHLLGTKSFSTGFHSKQQRNKILCGHSAAVCKGFFFFKAH